jgi:hypothetical protein
VISSDLCCELIDEAVKAERERCARIAEIWACGGIDAQGREAEMKTIGLPAAIHGQPVKNQDCAYVAWEIRREPRSAGVGE